MRRPMRLCLAAWLCWLAAPAALAAEQAAAPAGAWVGVFHSYPFFVRMDLEIPPLGPGGKAETDMRVDSLVKLNSVGRAPTGVVKVTVAYDATARTLTVTPAANAYGTVGRLPAFSGVLDAERQVVGGVLVPANASGSPYFVLGKRDVADGAFLRALGDVIGRPATSAPAARQRGVLGAVAGALGGGDSPNPNRLREWVARFLAEYPDVDPYRTEMSKLFSMARNLFRDEYFQPFFGKPFDGLSASDLRAVTMEIRKVPRPRANFPEERPNGALSALGGAFSPSGTYSAPDITLAVLATRFIDGWRTQSARWAETAAPAANALETIAAFERAEQQVLAMHWPSERAAFATTLAASRGRLASPALARRIDELLAGATSFAAVPQLTQALRPVPAATAAVRGTPSPVGRRPLPNQPAGPAGDTLARLLALATDEERRTQLARVEARLGELVAAEVQRDRAALAALGSGLEGLQAGQRWHAAAATKYADVSNRPEVAALMNVLAEGRQALLRESETALMGRIKGAGSTADLAQLRATYLGVPSDSSDPTGSRLLQAAQQRASGLQQAEQTAAVKQAEAERQANSACAKAANDNGPDGVPGEPTERDMCQAVERVLLGSQENLKGLQDECRGLDARSNPISGLMCLMGSASQVGGGPQMSLRSFQKIACASAVAVGRPGFFCDYVVNLRTDNAMTAPMFNRFGGEITTARFVRTQGQWIFLPPK